MPFDTTEVYKSTLAYYNNDELPAKVWMDKYALKNKEGEYLERTPADMHKRLASEFHRIESGYKNSMSYKHIYSLLENFKYIVPQGSPMYGIGNPYVNISLSNCVVVASPEDSMTGIINTARDLANLYKNRCGVGLDISSLRPEGMRVNNSSRTTTGAWSFADFYSFVTRMVGQRGRRGASALTLDIRHPDSPQFIGMKRDLEKITGANISVRISDDFMRAVESDSMFTLKYPVGSETPVITREIRAKQLWDSIVSSATASGEPGLLMWDTIVNNLPAHEYDRFKTSSINPCSELFLSAYDSCRLVSLPLKHFILNAFSKKARFDFSLFEKVIRAAVRLSDDLVDLELEKVETILRTVDTQEEQDLWSKLLESGKAGRRIGLGTHGLADMLACAGFKYDSEESVALVNRVYRKFRDVAYDESCELAKERGVFPEFSWEVEKGNAFIKRLPKKLRDKIKKFGRRNISILTLAPTGSVSIVSQTSSGVEPVFRNKYIRRRKVSDNDTDTSVDFVDNTGDSWKEYDVYHRNLKEWFDSQDMEPSDEKVPDIFVTSDKIDWNKRIEVQATIQKYIDHGISSTINLPRHTDKSVVSEIYFNAWRSGLKGITVYVDGSRKGVLVEKREGLLKHSKPPKRPSALACEIHQTSVKGTPWVVFVGLMEHEGGNLLPYEVFAGESYKIKIPKKYTVGRIVKRPRKTTRSMYDLVCGNNDDELLIHDIVEMFDDSINAAFTRTISLALRHGTPVRFVVEQLGRDKDGDLFSFSKAVARVLKKYIQNGETPTSDKVCPSCSHKTLVYEDGCPLCKGCGWSRCM